MPLTRACVVPTVAAIEAALTPPTYPSLPLAKSPDLPQAPPTVVGGICNNGMPSNTTLARYVWVVQQFIEQVCCLAVQLDGTAKQESTVLLHAGNRPDDGSWLLAQHPPALLLLSFSFFFYLA